MITFKQNHCDNISCFAQAALFDELFEVKPASFAPVKQPASDRPRGTIPGPAWHWLGANFGSVGSDGSAKQELEGVQRLAAEHEHRLWLLNVGHWARGRGAVQRDSWH